MFKMLGGITLAIGAGALYYLWDHEHDGLHDQLHEAGDHLRETGKHMKDTVEDKM